MTAALILLLMSAPVPPPKPAVPPKIAGFTGTIHWKGGSGPCRFDPDGTWWHRWPSGGGMRDRNGTWEVKGGVLYCAEWDWLESLKANELGGGVYRFTWSARLNPGPKASGEIEGGGTFRLEKE